MQQFVHTDCTTPKIVYSPRVQVSGVEIFGVEVSVGSKCPWGRNIRGRSVGGVQMSLGSKCRWGPNVPGVEMSVGSKCQWGQSVFGVEMGVNHYSV